MNILDQIVEHKKQLYKTLSEKFEKHGVQDHEKMAAISLQPAFKITHDPTNKLYVIAECKKASPSKKMIATHYDVKELVNKYQSAGASAISVLCDKQFFHGSFADLETAHQHSALPLLQKDFVICKYQIYLGRCSGASMVLLIATILTAKQIVSLAQFARRLGMGYLIELYDEVDAETLFEAIGIEPSLIENSHSLIGINNRNLKTFEVDFYRSFAIKKKLPKACRVISESGIETVDDLMRIKQEGFFGALIGEAFVKRGNDNSFLSEMMQN